MGLVGRRTGRRWQLGDSVRVRLSRVDLAQRQVDFELLDAGAAATQAPCARHGAEVVAVAAVVVERRRRRRWRRRPKRSGRGGRG